MESDSYSRQHLDDLYFKLVMYFEGNPREIAHLTKVHSYARLIGLQEELDDTTQFILEAAAYIHDVGVKPALEKYGKCNGELQEQEGPIVAQKMLSELGFENYMIERICFLVENHHTYEGVEGMDYRILLEADALVNFYDDDVSERSRRKMYDLVFETEAGRELYRLMYEKGDED